MVDARGITQRGVAGTLVTPPVVDIRGVTQRGLAGMLGTPPVVDARGVTQWGIAGILVTSPVVDARGVSGMDSFGYRTGRRRAEIVQVRAVGSERGTRGVMDA